MITAHKKPFRRLNNRLNFMMSQQKKDSTEERFLLTEDRCIASLLVDNDISLVFGTPLMPLQSIRGVPPFSAYDILSFSSLCCCHAGPHDLDMPKGSALPPQTSKALHGSERTTMAYSYNSDSTLYYLPNPHMQPS